MMNIDFVGTGKRLATGDVGKVARNAMVETAVLLALLEVETRGKGFDSKNRLKMLFEPHVFYRRLKGAERARAVREGLAYKKWGAKPYPRSFDARYQQLRAAIRINRAAAFGSCSWGLPQMMGFNHKKAGFDSAEQMVVTMLQGEYEQLVAMVTWLDATGILKHMRGKDFSLAKSWIPVVKRYNGSGFRKNAYHTKAAIAFVKHSNGQDVVIDQAVMLRLGLKGEEVRALQADLRDIGYNIVVDGRFGPETEEAVEHFQSTNELTVDGIVGPKTRKAVSVVAEKVEVDSDEPFRLLYSMLDLIFKFLFPVLKGA